jgi:hypothetical protein
MLMRRSIPGGARTMCRLSAVEGAGFDIDLLAAALRADATETHAFVEGLAAKLETALPGRVSVKRARNGLFGPKLVQQILVDAGDERLELARGSGDALEMRRARISGGIVIKREAVDSDAWLLALTSAMAAEAQRSEQTRQALERLLIT